MQLDLFRDNRRTILQHDLVAHLEGLQLAEAFALSTDLLQDEPADQELLHLIRQISVWQQRLAAFNRRPCSVDILSDIYKSLSPDLPKALLKGLQTLIYERLRALPDCELLYRAPDFHIGSLLLSMGKYHEALHWLNRAIEGSIAPLSRFLGWRGDALYQLRQLESACDAYLAALLDDPVVIAPSTLDNLIIRDLLFCLEEEDDLTSDEDKLQWLPAWGWLEEVFRLSLTELATDPSGHISYLEAHDQQQQLATGHLWFEYLRYAELLRTHHRNDTELIRVRKRMRQLNPEMFARYMDKIGKKVPGTI